jgi:hypothetical protein
MTAEYTVSDLYGDLPVKIDSKDLAELSGEFVEQLYDNDPLAVTNFLNTVHRIIYDFLIYAVGDKEIQNALITRYAEQLEKPIKRALLAQAEYLLVNGNIEMDNGNIAMVNGVSAATTQENITKILCPTVINILSGTKPNILWVGE